MAVPARIAQPSEPRRAPPPSRSRPHALDSEGRALAEEIVDAWLHFRDAVKSGDKDRLRHAHLEAKRHDATTDYGRLLRHLSRLRSYFPSPARIDPERIDPIVVPVRARTVEEQLFKVVRGYWSMPYSKGYGRRMRFLVLDQNIDAVIGIIGLQSPSADLACRDTYLKLPQAEKLRAVNNTLDAYTIGATPAYAPLLGGKLVAGLLHSNTIRREYWRCYGASTTTQLGLKVPQPLLAITTASAFGRSSIYNRLKFRDRLLARPLGYTKGFGIVHFEALYPRIACWLTKHGRHVPAGFGNGPKVRWQNVVHALHALGLPAYYLEHGIKREVFLFELVENLLEVCRSGALPIPLDFNDSDWSEYWKQRWAVPRAIRQPDWFHFDAYSMLSQSLEAAMAR